MAATNAAGREVQAPRVLPGNPEDGQQYLAAVRWAQLELDVAGRGLMQSDKGCVAALPALAAAPADEDGRSESSSSSSVGEELLLAVGGGAGAPAGGDGADAAELPAPAPAAVAADEALHVVEVLATAGQAAVPAADAAAAGAMVAPMDRPGDAPATAAVAPPAPAMEEQVGSDGSGAGVASADVASAQQEVEENGGTSDAGAVAPEDVLFSNLSEVCGAAQAPTADAEGLACPEAANDEQPCCVDLNELD